MDVPRRNLLKEVRESRDYFVTDEVVYLLQSSEGDGVDAGYVERYPSNEYAVWVFIRGKFEFDYLAVLEFAKPLDGLSGDFGSRPKKDWRNDSMLVSIVEDSQDFKKTDLRPARTVIRLKALCSGDSGLRSTQKGFPAEEGSEVLQGVLQDGEGCICSGRSALGDNVEGDVIQRRPEVVGDITHNHTQESSGNSRILNLKLYSLRCGL